MQIDPSLLSTPQDPTSSQITSQERNTGASAGPTDIENVESETDTESESPPVKSKKNKGKRKRPTAEDPYNGVVDGVMRGMASWGNHSA